MSKKTKSGQGPERWVRLVDDLRRHLPHGASWWADEESFSELRLKAKADGTILAIAKGYGSDGGPVVCFGSGYGLEGALMALDASIQGGNWRFDKPWSGK